MGGLVPHSSGVVRPSTDLYDLRDEDMLELHDHHTHLLPLIQSCVSRHSDLLPLLFAGAKAIQVQRARS